MMNRGAVTEIRGPVSVTRREITETRGWFTENRAAVTRSEDCPAPRRVRPPRVLTLR